MTRLNMILSGFPLIALSLLQPALAITEDAFPPKAQVVVTIDTVAPPKPYSPMLFGGFVEHFHRQVYGGL